MITVDGREIKFKNKTREETVKIIIDAIEKGYLSDEVIHQIQLICVVGSCQKQIINALKENKHDN